MEKTVLILGNGFDLAHNLPTKYNDFLIFCIKIYCIFNDNKYDIINNRLLNKLDTENDILTIIDNKISNDDCSELKKVYELIRNNFWFHYFAYLLDGNQSINFWIDFEREIQYVIDRFNLDGLNFNLSYEYCMNKIYEKEKNDENIDNKRIMGVTFAVRTCFDSELENIIMKDFFSMLSKELNNLTEVLNIYFYNFVNKYKVKPIELIKQINPDFVLTFNYTNTYEKIYNSDVKIQHIHGQASTNDKTKNNIVLGIPDFNSEDENGNFISFLKSSLRIVNSTGMEYKKILKEYKNNLTVHIFGHSLGYIDHDILQEFIMNDSIKVVIYYNNNDDKINKHKNLRDMNHEKYIDKLENDEIIYHEYN